VIGVAHPWLLLLAPAAAAVVLFAARGTSGGRPVRRAAIVRAATVTLLVLALAEPRLGLPGRALDVVVVVDASDSTAAASAEVQAWLRELEDARGRGDRVAVVAVGRDAQVEHGLREGPMATSLGVRVDGSQTDLASGLRLARGLAGGDQRRRVVLLTDGHATRGDTDTAIAELRDACVAVDLVPLDAATASDVLVRTVGVPGTSRVGERYEVEVVLENTGATAAGGELVVHADGQEIARRTLELPPGSTTVRIPRDASEEGNVRYSATLRSAASTQPRNDTAMAAVQVLGTPSVLLVEGAPGDGTVLTDALTAGGVEVVRRDVTVEGFPALDELLGHEATVVVDVHWDQIGDEGAVALDAYVRDAGRGLTVVGGERSYGLGAYDGTPVEELLPVFARVQDPQRRPSVAQALVVDVSGSMAACHCRPDGFAGGVREVDGPNKTAISRRAVERAIAAMDNEDTIGVLAFHTETEWVLPLQQVPDAATVSDAVNQLAPDGDTHISVALEEAIDGLRDVEARLRHIVLFSDGFTNEHGLAEVTARAADEGITVSVVGTGEMPDDSTDVLRAMADAGGGRYYPGRDLESIPGVLASEVMLVSRPVAEEGRFLPVVTSDDPLVGELAASPPLFGYIATTPKPTARTLLRIGDERDPLLSTWQAGYGTVTAWTSDTAGRWASSWTDWDGARDLWTETVRSTLPTEDDARVAAQATVGPDALRVEVRASDPWPNGAQANATVVDPDGQRVQIPLRLEELDTFGGELPTDLDGVHAATVEITHQGEVVARRTVTAIRSYSAEYAITGPVGPAVAALTPPEARIATSAAEVFDRDGTSPGRTPVDPTPWLLVAALLLLPLDVAFRRLRLEPSDVQRLLRRRPAADHDGTSSTAEGARSADAGRSHSAVGSPPDTGTAPAPPTGRPVTLAPPPPAAARPEAPTAPPGAPAAPPGAPTPPPGAPAGPPPPSGPPVETVPPPPPGGLAGLLEERRRARGDGPPS
jgi:Mg-chelatase subunit ChlD